MKLDKTTIFLKKIVIFLSGLICAGSIYLFIQVPFNLTDQFLFKALISLMTINVLAFVCLKIKLARLKAAEKAKLALPQADKQSFSLKSPETNTSLDSEKE